MSTTKEKSQLDRLEQAERACFKYLPIDEHENLMAVMANAVNGASLFFGVLGFVCGLITFAVLACIFYP